MSTRAEIAAKLANIPDDEPLFLLRGRDVIAAKMVSSWSDLAYDLGVNVDKIVEANNCAGVMRAYPVRRLPD